MLSFYATFLPRDVIKLVLLCRFSLPRSAVNLAGAEGQRSSGTANHSLDVINKVNIPISRSKVKGRGLRVTETRKLELVLHQIYHT